MHRFVCCLVAALSAGVAAAQAPSAAVYHIYRGSTHAHTQYTWSHGEQWSKNDCKGILVFTQPVGDPDSSGWKKGYVSSDRCPSIFVVSGLQYPGPNQVLRPDWHTVQGPPSRHFELARQNNFDFYVSSDHSQEGAFWPWGPDNPTWKATKQQAAAATDKDFVALAGFEYSENDGPGGTGHINVINADSILDALYPGIDLPYLYKWLERARPNGSGPVVASFNHPGKYQYNDFDYRDPAITNIITMLEVINSNIHIHYEGFIEALDKGWKVSPVSGLDNHGTTGISRLKSRTFVLATSRSKLAILDAMKNRRTYASLDNDIQCRYTVNGAIMGSTLNRPSTFKFDIHITDPDTSNPLDKITKIDIVKDHGDVVQTYTPTQPGYTVQWAPVIHDPAATYFFVRVWSAGGGDSPKPLPDQPMTWLAPVWTGRSAPPSPHHEEKSAAAEAN
ncbi:MAG TPA: hypothetical protein VFW30_03110 [Bryocella sp.]|nr:hypothetical protein [Bryocella sp.]